MIRAAACLSLALWAGPAAAQEDPAEAARAAARQLESATVALSEAESARDRVKSLTATVRAYEAGLEAMRDGLRRVATREGQIERKLEANEARIAALLGTIQTIETSPPPLLILHPSGPLGSARAAMMLADVTPGLSAQATALRRDLGELKRLRTLQDEAAQTLQTALGGLQSARTRLAQAMADRTDLPKRFTEDPGRTAVLVASARTLDAFASGLSGIAAGRIAENPADITARKGRLELPVQGVILRSPGEADAAGISRPGIVLAARPRALVTAPAASTIRYQGPLLDLGTTVILEPMAGLMIVLSGLGEVFGETGQVLPSGAPVGLMGGAQPEIGALFSPSGDATGIDRSETLYMEVIQDGSPINPNEWFHTDNDG